MVKLHRLLFATLLLGASAAQSASMRYAYTAQGVGSAAGGTLVGLLTLDMAAVDIHAPANNGDFRNAGSMSGEVFGGVQDGLSYTETDMDFAASGDTEHFYNFYDLGPNWPVFQLTLRALFGVDAIQNGDLMPVLRLEDFGMQREVRFQMPGEAQYKYELTSLRALDAVPGAVPLPNSAALVLAGLLGMGWRASRRGGRSTQA